MNNTLLIIRAKTYTFGICLLLLTGFSCEKEKNNTQPISTDKRIETFYLSELSKCINTIDSLSTLKNSQDKIACYKIARMHFKTIEPILAFIDQNNYKSLNAPNILQVKEEDLTDVKINNPFGFQVIEELIHETPIDISELQSVVNITSSRLKLVKQNTFINLKDHHIIWLLRNQIVRVATTGITGFDSSVLSQSLKESQFTYETLIKLIQIFKDKFTSKQLYKALLGQFQSSIKQLNDDFVDFDRYTFIKTSTDPQLKLLVETQDDWGVEFPFEMALSNTMLSLFAPNALNTSYFTDYKSDTTHLKQKELLGKQLFNDVRLSKNNTMACATCHIKDLAFTDGRTTFDNKQKRNTPTLTYSGYQQLYFLDARAGSLEGQIVGVANNHDEFNLPMDSIVKRVKNDKQYKKLMDSLYNNTRDDFNVRHAISSYIRTLNLFNSKFDNNINGKENSLTESEKKGFNIFMGKAACATCHFPPVFNGTVPPNFTDTELEIIGVPDTKQNKKLDDDLGRFYFFNTKERKGAFKTTTVRNVEKTAPYMHNGVYETLEEVVSFYNKGGGNGLGFNIEHQTLPFDELNLTDEEQAHIVAFMKTLTDSNGNKK
ncbi:cytochrome c peroxidase [Mariniflexile soesokkakense]|uniref:Cytochrome c peroxidase n=1 Tax=Mariniflexile soesokkakense TaxID=1343160 RepID=A0ABV0ABS4_9FLAO